MAKPRPLLLLLSNDSNLQRYFVYRTSYKLFKKFFFEGILIRSFRDNFTINVADPIEEVTIVEIILNMRDQVRIYADEIETLCYFRSIQACVSYSKSTVKA